MKDFFGNLKTVILFYILGMLFSYFLYSSIGFLTDNYNTPFLIVMICCSITNSLFIVYITALLLTKKEK